MSTTESPFSLTIKVGPNNDLLTGRADTKEEMTQRIADLQNYGSLQGSSQKDDTQAAVEALAGAGVATQVVEEATAIDTQVDEYGNEWTYGHPDAPDLPDGHDKYARKKRQNKAGRVYVGWFDPVKGPSLSRRVPLRQNRSGRSDNTCALLQVIRGSSLAGEDLRSPRLDG